MVLDPQQSQFNSNRTCSHAITFSFTLTEGWGDDDIPMESDIPESSLDKSIAPSPKISLSSIDQYRGRVGKSMFSIDILLPALFGLSLAGIIRIGSAAPS